MHAFEHQDSSVQTLPSLSTHPDLAKGRTLSPPAREFVRCHDTGRVVFECGSALDDEAVLKIASDLGTSGASLDRTPSVSVVFFDRPFGGSGFENGDSLCQANTAVSHG
jgi:hypothetical protein